MEYFYSILYIFKNCPRVSYYFYRARPVVYLKADTKITSGDGTLENMFVVLDEDSFSKS